MNEANMKAMQTEIDMVKNKLRTEMKSSIQTSLSNQTNEIKNIMASLLQMNTASTSGSGSLPSNTVDNPKGKLKAITTRNGLVTDGPTIPTPPKSITLEVDERVEETYTDPDLADELKCKALADLGASINLMPLSIWKELGLPELIPTRMTLELANRAICTPAKIARDVFVSVGKFTFLADFVIVDYESNPRVPIILGRPFLRTAHALIDVHDEEIILRDGDERLTLNMKHDTSSYSNQPQRELVNLINIFNVSIKIFLEVLFSNQPSGNPTFLPHQELTLPEVTNDIFDLEGCNVLSEKLPDLNYTKDLHPFLMIIYLVAVPLTLLTRILGEKIICDLDKTPDMSQRSPQNCPKCGNPVYGHYCQRCALLREKFKDDLFASCVEDEILQYSSKTSNDNSNIANALQEPFVIYLHPGIFCHQCTCKLCGNGAHYGHNCLPKVPILPNPEPFNNHTIKELPLTVQSFDPKSDLNCPKCGNPVYGHYCQRCALLREKFKDDLFASCVEDEILQYSSKTSNDNSNIANALQEPFVIYLHPASVPA
nr:reverse transcriptase domain-containing protein [Tanacetum cinerariifolium]